MEKQLKPSEKFTVPIGPQHPALKEPGHFLFSVEGEIVTDANGQASFSTVIPPGAGTGPGLVVALVTTDQFGETSARPALTVSS